MARDRFLLRADVEGYQYADILEVRPNRVRLLRPSGAARRSARFSLVGVALLWYFVAGPILVLGVPSLVAAWALPLALVPAWLLPVLAGAAWWLGLIVSLMWWDDRTLALLARSTRDVTDVKLLGMTSYWTLQELRAAAPQREIRIAVRGTHRKVSRILTAAGVLPAPGA